MKKILTIGAISLMLIASNSYATEIVRVNEYNSNTTSQAVATSNMVLRTEATTMSDQTYDIGTEASKITATLRNGILTISGTGTIKDYIETDLPEWYIARASISKVVIESGVTNISKCLFYGCNNLNQITISETVTKIDDKAFYGCNSLATITIPGSVETIGSKVFDNCAKLNAINVNSDNAKFISENGILYNKEQTKLIKYPQGKTDVTCNIISSVSTIGENAFNSCKSLTKITLPENLITIEENAFKGISNITIITIPSKVTEIKEGVFNECTKLEEIKVNTGNTMYTVSDGVLFNIDKTELIKYPEGKNSTTYNVPETVKTIKQYAFSVATDSTLLTKEVVLNANLEKIEQYAFKNSGITKIVIPEKVTKIEEGTFEGCREIQSLDLGKVIEIGENAFYHAGKLTTITLPNTLTKIGKNAFKEFSGLTEVILPESVIEIGEAAFKDCIDLTNADLSATKITVLLDNCFDNCTKLETVKLPLTLTTIGKSVFLKNTALTKMDLSETKITTIPDYCFETCTALTEVKLPKTVEIIGKSAFKNCHKMNTTLPIKLTTIGENAFENCNSLTEIIIPGSVNNISKRAFYNCLELTKLEIQEGVKTIGESAFESCQKLVDISMEDTVETIERNAFYNCNSLKSVGISDRVTVINENVFKNCTELNKVYLPLELTTIKDGAFDKCTSLKELAVPDSVKEISTTAFYVKTVNGDKVIQTDIYCKSDKSPIAKYIDQNNYQGFWSGKHYKKDSESPTISSVNITPNTEWTNRLEVTVISNDKDAGLAKNPYSFDDGKTWQTSNMKIYEDDKNTSITIKVRDALGNISTYAEKINLKVDTTAPTFEAIYKDTTKDNDDAVYYVVSAKDALSGVYQYNIKTSKDASDEWTENNYKWIPNATEKIYIYVKDKAGNVAMKTKAIKQCESENKTHDWGNGWIIEEEATCTTGGTRKRTCTVCGATEEETFNKAEHNWNEGIVEKEATCIEEGVKKYTCSICGNIKNQVIQQNPDNHTAVDIEIKEATCTENGYEGGKKCKDCGKIVEESNTIEALGHQEELVPAKEATCTEDGYEGEKRCTRCGETLEEPHKIEKLGHQEGEWRIIKVATCEETGIKIKECERCKKELQRETIPETNNHNLVNIETVEATCTENGHEGGKRCTICGRVTEEPHKIEKLGHQEEKIPTVEATCTTDGHEGGTKCTRCGIILEEPHKLEKLPHNYKRTYTLFEDKKIMVENGTCEDCGHNEELNRTNHVSSFITKPATCTIDGEIEYTGIFYVPVPEGYVGGTYAGAVIEKIPATGHTEVIDSAVAATCATKGKTEGKHCSVCNTVLVEQKEIQETGHTEVIDPAVAATCTTKGKTEGKHCSVCNTVLVAQIEIPETGHTYGEWIVDKEPTITEEGHKYKECSVCKSKEEERISKLTPEFTTDYKVKEINGNKYIYINIDDTVENVIKNIKTNYLIEIYKKNEEKANSDTRVGTGATIRTQNGSQIIYTIVVKGDINGDGNIDFINDIVTMNNYRLNRVRLSQVELLAANYDEDFEEKVDFIHDIVAVNNLRLQRIKK